MIIIWGLLEGGLRGSLSVLMRVVQNAAEKECEPENDPRVCGVGMVEIAVMNGRPQDTGV